jgi:hypothetical protein
MQAGRGERGSGLCIRQNSTTLRVALRWPIRISPTPPELQMKKLVLEIDSLCVESFQVNSAMAGLRAGSFTDDHSCMSFCVPDPVSERACRV